MKDSIDTSLLDGYTEITINSDNIKKILQQIAYMDCFTVVPDEDDHINFHYTELRVSDDSRVFYCNRVVTRIEVPGRYHMSGDSLILNWCQPGYIGEGRGTVMIQSECSPFVDSTEVVTVVSIVSDYVASNYQTDFKAYYLKKPTPEKPMNITQEITDLKKEIQMLRDLLADKDVGKIDNASMSVGSPTVKWKVNPTQAPTIQIPSCLGRYYKPSDANSLIDEHYGNLKYIHTQTPEMCIAAVNKSMYALQYVHNQTPEICKAAIMKDAKAIQFVENQTTELCRFALTIAPSVIGLIRNPTAELVEHAFDMSDTSPAIAGAVLSLAATADTTPYLMFKQLVERSPHFLAYVPEKMRTDELIKVALNGAYQTISLLEDQKPWEEYVVAQTWEALGHIRNPTPSLYEFALDVHVAPPNQRGYDLVPDAGFKYIDLLSISSANADDLYQRLKNVATV